jgi:hypothetical protein
MFTVIYWAVGFPEQEKTFDNETGAIIFARECDFNGYEVYFEIV